MTPLTFTGFVNAILDLENRHTPSRSFFWAHLTERQPVRGADGTAEIDSLEAVDLALSAEMVLEEIGYVVDLVNSKRIGEIRRIGDLYVLACSMCHVAPDFSVD